MRNLIILLVLLFSLNSILIQIALADEVKNEPIFRIVYRQLPTKIDIKSSGTNNKKIGGLNLKSSFKVGIETTSIDKSEILGLGLYVDKSKLTSSGIYNDDVYMEFTSVLFGLLFGFGSKINSKIRLEFVPFGQMGMSQVESSGYDIMTGKEINETSEWKIHFQGGINSGIFISVDSLEVGFTCGYLMSNLSYTWENDLNTTYNVISSGPMFGVTIGTSF